MVLSDKLEGGPPPTIAKGAETYYITPYGYGQRARPHRLLTVVKLVTCACLASWVCRFALPRLFTLPFSSNLKHSGTIRLYDDPASEFADDDFPLREHEPWDISTDFPYPRTLSYQVTEGTWLRLDVHPMSGDIVFDMAGDVYCLPADSYMGASGPVEGITEAVPVLTGVPYDADPRFSPTGDRLAFKSDAGLGIDNLWVMPWAADGCTAMDVRARANSQKMDEELLVQGVKETEERKLRRLTREGRADGQCHSILYIVPPSVLIESVAQRITNETYNWVSDPRWHPSGDKVIATKWYFSSRSLGAGEGWEFPVPALNAGSPVQVEVGAGKRLVSKRLPMGWTKEDYVEQQIGHEQFIWAGDDALIYSGNVKDVDGSYTYSKGALASVILSVQYS